MVITALGQGTAASALYPEYVGRRGIFVGTASGPAAYSLTAGDAVSVALKPYYIDAFAGSATTASGTYIVRFHPTSTGTRQQWIARWYATAGGAEVADGTPLAAEKIQVGLFGGTS